MKLMYIDHNSPNFTHGEYYEVEICQSYNYYITKDDNNQPYMILKSRLKPLDIDRDDKLNLLLK